MVVLSLILLASCSQPVTGIPPPSTQPPALAGAAAPGWQTEWEKLVAAAKKEGTLNIYTSAGSEVSSTLRKAFKEKFGIETEYVSGRGGEISARLLSERRAGLFLGDIAVVGPITALTALKPAGAFAPIKPLLILPEILDTSAYFDGEIPFIDKEGMYVIGYGPYVLVNLAVNTDLVPSGEVKSYADLLNPKWKAKIIMGDPTVPGGAMTFFFMTGAYLMNLDFHRQLVKQEPVVTRDLRQQVEWLARGKYPVALAPKEDIVGEFQVAGAPIKWISPAEGGALGASGSGTVAYLDRAPHPNAAKVFANWLMSKEGLTVLSRSALLPTARKDLPTDFLKPEVVRDPKIKYIDANKEEVRLKEQEFVKLAQEIYGPLLR